MQCLQCFMPVGWGLILHWSKLTPLIQIKSLVFSCQSLKAENFGLEAFKQSTAIFKKIPQKITDQILIYPT